MKSVVLVPYCPYSPDTGGKVEMVKHLELLRELGPCKILSASSRPVGAGWTETALAETRRRGFEVVLREEGQRRLSIRQKAGICYAAIAKGFGMEKAFGHANPYHRYAFPADWWMRHTEDADLAVINYSYWSWLPCACPKVVVLLDLWSDYMWGGHRRESEGLADSDLVVVISVDEQKKLNARGIKRTMWSPPFVEEKDCGDSAAISLIGSGSRFNREGLRWLSRGGKWPEGMHLYGGLAAYCKNANVSRRTAYDEWNEPYSECGIVLMTTQLGMGVQIKGIEALACGRAIVARRGAMRGLPPGDGAWIEVASPAEMLQTAERLQKSRAERAAISAAARQYYHRHLNAAGLKQKLVDAYVEVAG